MSYVSVPNSFAPTQTIYSAQVNANFTALATAINNISAAATGVYASDIAPTNSAQATFGGSQTYTFPAATVAVGSVTGSAGIFAGQVSCVNVSTGDITASSIEVSGTVNANAFSTAGNVTASGGVYTNNVIQQTTGAALQVSNTGNYVAVKGSNATVGVSIENATTGTAIARFVSGGTQEAYITSAGAYTQTSDQSKKKNINYVPDYGLDTILKLRPVAFDWNDTGAHQFGFIAQDVQLVVPTAVLPFDDGTLGISYTELIPILTKAVQELLARVQSLESRA
jgi:hypothetical protein